MIFSLLFLSLFFILYCNCLEINFDGLSFRKENGQTCVDGIIRYDECSYEQGKTLYCAFSHSRTLTYDELLYGDLSGIVNCEGNTINNECVSGSYRYFGCGYEEYYGTIYYQVVQATGLKDIYIVIIVVSVIVFLCILCCVACCVVSKKRRKNLTNGNVNMNNIQAIPIAEQPCITQGYVVDNTVIQQPYYYPQGTQYVQQLQYYQPQQYVQVQVDQPQLYVQVDQPQEHPQEHPQEQVQQPEPTFNPVN